MARIGVPLLVLLQACAVFSTPYNGKLIGSFSSLAHDVSGTVYAASTTKLIITGFTYDGTAPDAFLWIGDSSQPDSTGVIVPHDSTDVSDSPLGQYHDTLLVVDLPSGSTLSDYSWLSVWCREFSANFGSLVIPASFEAPQVHNLGVLPTRAHQVRADSVKILDVKTLRFENLYYDGTAPDAYFWAGNTVNPTSGGTRLIWKPNLPATGSNQRLDRAFRGDTIVVTLPGDMTIFDITYVSLWCVIFTQNFGHVTIDPSNLNVPAIPPTLEYQHCQVLEENNFQVSWSVDGDDLKVELAGRVEPGNYLAFGRSGSDSRSQMIGSDVVVGWMDQAMMQPMVVDYTLNGKAQCSINDGEGSCPDDIAGGVDNAVLEGLKTENAITRISYRKPLNTGDSADRPIPTDVEVYIVWAIGPINPDGRVAKHTKASYNGITINFGRAGMTSCPEFTAVSGGGGDPLTPWPTFNIQDETSFVVEIGQSGGTRGYTGITDKVGWGIAWYVNQLLIPEITVERGTTYNFSVFGGDDPAISARYHPLYITNDPAGGYTQKTEAEKMNIEIYAGPTDGPYCEWEVKQDSFGVSPDEFDSFPAYREHLTRVCDNANPSPGILLWTPDEYTPDVVYYQCYTHRYLGWKINVVGEQRVTGPMPGGSTPSGSTPGASTPVASTPGASTPVASTPGGSTTVGTAGPIGGALPSTTVSASGLLACIVIACLIL